MIENEQYKQQNCEILLAECKIPGCRHGTCEWWFVENMAAGLPHNRQALRRMYHALECRALIG